MEYKSKFKAQEIDVLLDKVKQGGNGGGVPIVSSEEERDALNLPIGSLVSVVKTSVDFAKLYQPTDEDFNSEGLLYIKNPEKFSRIKNLRDFSIEKELLKSTLESLPLNTGSLMSFYDISSGVDEKMKLSFVLIRAIEEGGEVLACYVQCTDDNYLGGGDYGESSAFIAMKQGDEWAFDNDLTEVLERMTRSDYEFVYGGCTDYLTGLANNELSNQFNWLKIPYSPKAFLLSNEGWKAISFESEVANLPSMPILNLSTNDAPIAATETSTKAFYVFPNRRYIIARPHEGSRGRTNISLIKSECCEDVFVIELRGLVEVTFPSELKWENGESLSTLDSAKVYVVTIKNDLASFEEYA